MLLLLDVVTRAALLLALSIAPPLFSPEPAPAGNPILAAVGAAAFLAAVLYGALRLRAWARGAALARVAAALLWASVAAALGAALYFSGDRAPLGRGVPFVAFPVWAALAVTAAMLAGTLRGKGITAAAVIACGALLFALASTWLGSPSKMWWEALRRDGEHAQAIAVLTRGPLSARDYSAARAVAAQCLSLHPASCSCQGARVVIAIRARAFGEALDHARAAHDRCPADGQVHALFAEALGLNGQAAMAEDEARRGLARGGPEARLRYALALGLSGLGRDAEAMDEAKRAFALGAGRDAALLIAQRALLKGDLDEAARVLTPVVDADPNDADAQYDLALVADRRGDYNRARSGYLAALRADPTFANARYNLVFLTHRRGVAEEAKHHARKFVEAYPGDARGAELERLVGAPR